ncbi:unnamed protein product [Paramecium sonneborni]|uniref:Uncharacterized protein n=1 Tax=Paramecium sonneborni TaxID=65129 RepID=A0A8S1PVJ4_9CILI|nr:unnamed protein product [Paramecium sonneborni]
MEDRALRTNLIINRKQDYQPTKLESTIDNHYLKNENWNYIDYKNKNQYKNYETQIQNGESKNHYQSYQIVENHQMDKEQNNNTNLKQSYYYEQSKPYTPNCQQTEHKYDQTYQDKQKFEEKITHSTDKYLQQQSKLPFGNRTPMDPKSNMIVNTTLDRENQNKIKNEQQQSAVKRDFKLPEYQRMYPEITRNKTNEHYKTNPIDSKETQEQNSFLDIEKRLQQRREQAEKIAQQNEAKLTYYSKSQEYSQRQQQTGLGNSQERIKQFQENLRSEVQDKLREQQNQYKLDSRNLESNFDKKNFQTDTENNSQLKKDILELNQFKFTQLDGNFNINEREHKYNEYLRKDFEIDLKRSKFDQKSPYQARMNEDSKYQQIEYGKLHFSKKQEFDSNKRQDEQIKQINRSIQQNKSQNEDRVRLDLRSEGSAYKEQKDRFILKEKLYQETKQQYQVRKDNDQSQDIQRRLNLYEKLQQFDQGNQKKYQDSQNYLVSNLKQEKNINDQKQSTSLGYNNYDRYEIKRQDQQCDKMEFKRSQYQPEINQIKQELEKKYGQLKPEMNQQISEFDKRRVFEQRFRPEPIQAKIAGAREYLGQKYYQRDQYRLGQRQSYHEESSINDRLGLEKGNSRYNLNNKAIEDILQGTALSKYIEREKNQNRMADRLVSFTNSKINYQKSPIRDKEYKAAYDRLNQQQREPINDKYIINEYKIRQPSDQNLQKYCNPSSLITKQFGNYDRKDKRI